MNFSLHLLIAYCCLQRIILELNQNLRLPVEQAINTGKRFYAPDQKDNNNGIESAGMSTEEEKEKEVVSSFPSLRYHLFSISTIG